ncbi:aminotransferase class III-fold pyridoxal phosphate-dependent enzyme [Oceanobacillus oncorhynchi]|uniref:aminotransferase class III-fold pyridoxal phosphate-dependent enzyme n=1 Tax=Oceanobacillus oncorhynchi TaxID=545501 RepID=UPI001866E1F6|nr:aminotransferase class III-fold pyridoxal phosphate-dependent enzyme [Oceanobacillus oncorhynchi]
MKTFYEPIFSKNTKPKKSFRLAGGEGALFWNEDGQQIIDLSSQTVNLLFGQKHPDINSAITKQMDTFTFVDEDFQTRLHENALKSLYNFLPSKLSSINIRMNDGSSAVECAVKQAKKATGKTTVLTCEGIYLGQNTQTLNLRGWGPRRDEILVGSREDVLFAPLPLSINNLNFKNKKEVIDQLESIVKQNHNRIACILLDPVMLSYGICSSPFLKEYLRKANELSNNYNIPFILDESQSYGWVPDSTLAKHWNLDVDAIILAKGLAGGLPLSVCASKPELDLLERGDADYTHGGHPFSIAAMLATCDLMRREESLFLELCTFVEKVIGEYCFTRQYTETFGVGLIRAIQLTKFDSLEKNIEVTKKIASEALEAGVYIRTYNNTLGFKPPRVITKEQILTSLNVLFRVIDSNVK